MGLNKFILNRVFFLAIAPIASVLTPQTAYGNFWSDIPQTCPEEGYIETLVEPAKTEDGFVRITQYYFGSVEQRIHQAIYEIMTLEEYNTLEKKMTYEAYSWEAAKILKTQIEPKTNISDYDLIRTIDGNSFYRPLEQPVNQRVIETHEVETPARRVLTEKTQKRPEPEILSDGRLKVMISPMYYENLANGGQKGEVWSRYIKSRTSAVYQQVKCNEDKF